jgi:altronate hydrolase
MSKNYVQIDPKDNIIVAITNLDKGMSTTIQGKEVILKENIKQKHKYALNDFALGDQIYMYGVLIGKAIEPIEAGCAITIKNVKHASAEFNDSQEKFSWAAPDASKFERYLFGSHWPMLFQRRLTLKHQNLKEELLTDTIEKMVKLEPETSGWLSH